MKDYEILKKEIKEAGRTHVWLAKKLNISYDTFASYMVGRRKLNEDFVKQIKEIL